MLPWKRPTPHPLFATRAKELLTEVCTDVENRKGAPHGDDFKTRELWRREPHKSTLVGAEPWLAKCAWCEQFRAPKRELDVEHYRPTALVKEWEGTPPIISDTPPREKDVGAGYWWLAFSWENYSLACKPCNEGWKRNLFPVVAPRPTCVEGVEVAEVPLLLDPGSTFRAADHFRWTIDGIVEPVSPEGYATIVTCGLNRTDLRVPRGKVAVKTTKALGRFVSALRRGDRGVRRDASGALAELGSPAEERRSLRAWCAGS